MYTHLSHLAVLATIFGKNKSGKTTTICGKRVSYSKIVENNPSCPECLDWIRLAEKNLERIRGIKCIPE